MPSVMKMAKCPTFRCGAPSDLLGGLDFTQEAPFLPKIWSNSAWKLALPGDLTNNSKTCLDSQVFFWDWDLAMFSLFCLFRHVPSLPAQRFQDVSSLISLLIFTKLHGQLRYDLLRYIGHESTLDEAGICRCRWIMSMGCGSTGCQIFINFLHVNQSTYEVSHGKPNDPNHSILKWFIINI